MSTIRTVSPSIPTDPPSMSGPRRSDLHRTTHAHPAGRTRVPAVVTTLPAAQDPVPGAAVVPTDGRSATVVALRSGPAAARLSPLGSHREDEQGSLVAEYGLLAVVAATIAGVLISWASGGAVTSFFDSLLSTARGLVGA